MACDDTIARMKLTVRTIASAFFVILGSLAPLFSQTPAQPPEARDSNKSAVGLKDAPASAKAEAPVVRVAVVVLPPLVMEQKGSLTGFSIDLWNAIAKRLKVETSYKVLPDGAALEGAMRSKSADLTPSIFITSARDADFDFSYPTLESGLQIMVRETGATVGTPRPVLNMLRLLFSRTTVEWVGVALLLAIIPAHLVWLLERRHQGGIISSPNYFPGIFQAGFWGLSTLTSQAEGMPRQPVARVLSILWMFASGFHCVLHRPTNDDFDSRADSWVCRGAGRFAR